ncbi:MAG: hypothetical protein ACSHX8_11735 [Opitutaceae bacterium]
MWTISNFNVTDSIQLYASDGKPIENVARDESEGVCRIVISPFGYIDFESQAHDSEGLTYFTLTANGQVINYTSDLSVAVSVSVGSFTMTGPEGAVTGTLTAFPPLTGTTIEAFREMIRIQIVPYQDPPPPTVPKTDAELQTLASQYFPGNPYGFDLAMALYDWTSASFIRQDLFHQLEYTAMAGAPLDLPSMAKVIFGCSYPGYSYEDANFMNQFMMKPSTSEQDIYNQLLTVYQKVKPLAAAEMDVFANGVLSLPGISVAEYPQLYRGAMPLSGGYDTGDFSPSMFEFPGNAGPDNQPLYQALDAALQGTLTPGSIITTKGPWSFSNDLAGAKVWQNGILITLNPPPGATHWPGAGDITAFSINPGTFEINMPPPTRYRIESYQWEIIEKDGKPQNVCHFTMTHLGYCVEPM